MSDIEDRKKIYKESRLPGLGKECPKAGIVYAPLKWSGVAQMTKILKPDIPPPRDLEPLERMGHGFLLIAVGICCFTAVAAIFLLIA